MEQPIKDASSAFRVLSAPPGISRTGLQRPRNGARPSAPVRTRAQTKVSCPHALFSLNAVAAGKPCLTPLEQAERAGALRAASTLNESGASAAQDDTQRRAAAAASGVGPSQHSSPDSGPSVFPSAVVQDNSQADEVPRMRRD